ncbi:DNA binding domain with preference for A/T rich regions-like protein [Cordyceps javanica]|uniref:DNA binding domain with preference for A/T rich regions-like protein n=1 Tax=Cordyceps javanica TaxID=43265 RepID=A0A545VYM2_9HYPO|nr:DNA binding domain with preference for A/T rich regions-like protein [Cordyceps javanica]TQW06821.1 DNA binding domain with preference for A/T rich regions-like protein [Cordyceps javanica]
MTLRPASHIISHNPGLPSLILATEGPSSRSGSRPKQAQAIIIAGGFLAGLSPTRINSNPRIAPAPATSTTPHQSASVPSPAPSAIIPTPSLHQTPSSQGEAQSASVLHGRIADFNGQTSFLTTDGRVKNPVPSKLQGMADNKNGNFAVMHIDLGRSEKSMRNDAAKRTSEGTEAAARIANQAGYQSVKRSKLAWPPQDGDSSNSSNTAGLAPKEAKTEQARLLTLLRSVNPVAVADQLCKAVAFFGGIPGAPAPETRAHFPQSNQSNGSGSQFISWLAEIFPASADHSSSLPPASNPTNPNAAQNQTPPVSAQPPPSKYNATQQDGNPSAPTADAAVDVAADPNAPAAPVKRGRGRPKGSKGKPKNKDQSTNDAADPMTMQGSRGPNAGGPWPSQQLYASQQGTPGQSETGTPGKKRGRPKGSKNKPKNPTTSGAEPATTQDAEESQDSFMSPMSQMPNSMSLNQDGSTRPSSGPLGLSNMIEPGGSQTQSGWTTVGMQAGQDGSPAPGRKRKSDKQPDMSNSNASMPPGIQQDDAQATDPNGKRRRFSKDGAPFPQMSGQARMTSSESPIQNSTFQSPSQQMVSTGSFDPAQQPPNRKPAIRSQPPSRPGQSQSQQQQQQQFNQQSGHQPQSQQQPFGQQPGQHKSPIIGGNQPQQSSGVIDLSRSVMYNQQQQHQQQQQQLQHFMNQQRLSVDMNPATNPPSQFGQANSGGKSPMFQGHMVRAPSGDAGMQHQQRPSPASQSAQLNHDGSRMSQAAFAGRAPPVTSAGASPSMNSPFPPNYAARNYMGMNYGSMGGARVPDATDHSFGGSTGQMDNMNNTDQANMRHRMYQSMQQQQQRQ